MLIAFGEYLLFFAVNLVLYILLVPSTVLGAASGAIFGFWTGIIFYSASCFIASILTFTVVKFVFEDKIQRLIKKKSKLVEVQSLAEKEGIKLFFFVRFLPVHATIINALFSVSSIECF